MNSYVLYKITASGLKLPLHWQTKDAINHLNPVNRCPLEVARAAVGPGEGIGFILTEEDPYFLIDMDGCVTEGVLNDRALEVCQLFKGCYFEISSSGTGIHLIGSYAAIAPHGCRGQKGTAWHDTELYHKNRLIALTDATGDWSFDATVQLNATIYAWFPPKPDAALSWSTEPRPEWTGTDNDEELIAHALTKQSKAATYGGAASFADLWTANADALSDAYPDPKRQWDCSYADKALAHQLAFWTGCNAERVHELMWQSALVRDKWQARPDYVADTVALACSQQTSVYTGGRWLAPIEAAPSASDDLSYAMWVDGPDQARLFSGCYYIQDLHAAFLPCGSIVSPEQFRARAPFARRHYLIDDGGRPCKNAWEAFRDSQRYTAPQVANITYQPALPLGAVTREGKKTVINTCQLFSPPRRPGDVTPFLTHLSKLFPDERDRTIIISYMAGVLQYQGVKFRWCPIVQGMEGNGKTILVEILTQLVGPDNTKRPKIRAISNKFNDWVTNCTFIGVDEVYIPSEQLSVLEDLKDLITKEWDMVEQKNKDPIMRYLWGNFFMTTNHQTAIRLTRETRRFGVFFTPQQEVADLEAWGMVGDYFPALVAWLKGGGIEHVADYLLSYAIPEEFNPSTMSRAPLTTSSEQAVSANLGPIEQDIMEQVEQERPGFSGGFISSMALQRHLDARGWGRKISHNKYKGLLGSLGYVWSTALSDGRVSKALPGDPGKTKIYVKVGSPAATICYAGELMEAYLAAQPGAYL